MPLFEKVPSYVAASPQEVAAARTMLARIRTSNPAFDLQKGYRRSAVHARLNSSMALTALEYVEFGDVVPPGYSIASSEAMAASNHERAQEQARNRIAYEEAQRREREKPRTRQLSQREAQNTMSTKDYNEWVDRNQDLIARSVL